MSADNNIPVINNNNLIFCNGSAWQVWNKPKNANIVYFYVLGGGSGGGGGRSAAINTATGGGGGASAAALSATFLACTLPDTLYILVGKGGAGGAAESIGASGGLTYVSYQPNSASINILLQNGAAGPTGGGLGGSSTPGAGGTAGTVWGFATAINGRLGLVNVEPGQNGTAGTTTGGTVINLTPTATVTGASGGGACTAGGTGFAAGLITGSGFLPTIPAGVINAADSTIHGVAGYTSLPNNLSMSTPMFFTGGSGGGVATTTGRTGGKGGQGSFGSGGGGGGGAYSGTGGRGGDGGDGLVLITTL